MSCLPLLNIPAVQSAGLWDRWSVEVPWLRADDLRTKLSRRGFPATLCLDPGDRTARLEPWPGTSLAEFLGALGECARTRAGAA